MSNFWLLILGLGGLSYAAFIIKAYTGILRMRRKRQDVPTIETVQSKSCSIVLAARNEEDWIEKTLSSLVQQNNNLSASDFEIIVVDDRSVDQTVDVITKFAVKHQQIKLLHQNSVPAGVSPKKIALTLGIEKSRYDTIVLTDADCTHFPDWSTSLAKAIPPEGGMAIGQARFILEDNAPFWQRLQALDFASQGILSAGLASAGTPFNCCGASLAFSKNAYEKVNGWQGIEQFISGDDELLMRRFIAAGIPVNAASGADCVVLTRPPNSLRELFHQRARWGSKTLHYPPGQKALLSGIFLFYLALSLSPFIAWSWNLLLAGTAAFAVKILLDLLLLTTARPLFNDRVDVVEFLIAELLHPPVIAAMAIMGAFGSFDWKGTFYRTKGQV